MPELLEFFKALAEPKRLQIVGLLAQSLTLASSWPRCSALTEGTVSHHLSYFVHAGLVSAEAKDTIAFTRYGGTESTRSRAGC